MTKTEKKFMTALSYKNIVLITKGSEDLATSLIRAGFIKSQKGITPENYYAIKNQLTNRG